MTFVLKCDDCKRTFEYDVQPGDSLYTAVYRMNAKHERENAGPKCFLSAANYVKLVNVYLTPSESLDEIDRLVAMAEGAD